MPHRRSLLPSLVALLLVGSRLSAVAASAGSTDPRLVPRAADVKLAKTLIMARRDLPDGFVDKGLQKQSGPTPGVSCSEPNLHALVMTADASSHNFVRTRAGSYAEVESGATFFRSPTAAEKMIAVMMSRKIGSCLKHAFLAGLSKSSKGAVKIVSVHLTPLSETVADLHMRAWDLYVTFEASGVQLRDELVLDFLRRGRVVSSMMVDSLNGLTETEVKDISQTLTSRLESLPRAAVL